jgi:hypothetical protein
VGRREGGGKEEGRRREGGGKEEGRRREEERDRKRIF